MRTFYFMKSTTIKQFLSYSNLILLIINKIILTYQLDIKIILFSLKMTWNDNLNVLYINIKLNQGNAMYLQLMMQKKFLLKEMAIKNIAIHVLIKTSQKMNCNVYQMHIIIQHFAQYFHVDH